MPERGQVVVTGASRGIGAAIARDLAGRGYRIAGLSRGGTSATGTGHACDVTDEANLRTTLAAIAAAGPIVGLVNNAGAHRWGASAQLATETYDAVMRLDATAVMVGCREAYPHLKAAGGGLIVNIGSFFDRLGVPGNLAYCAAKAAVGAMTRCLAAEWARDGIRVLDIAPGYIETDLNRDFLAQEKNQAYLARRVPLGRAGTPEEVGRLVGALFEADIPYLTGETITLDGGHGANHA
ncbi:SDR family NAD(P)-dependent oxidoreductase [Acidiphilium sp.]|uniref:SDR family NAD(P)-dependent oxidoreductase n=1 Tax=Acidiphilium sp. TaxID=527 RepID=UPI0025856EAB|nr:SDR family oxidoreductase [Acidiphilium sp.]